MRVPRFPSRDEMVCYLAVHGRASERVKAKRQIEEWRRDQELSLERRRLLARYFDGEFNRTRGRQFGPTPKGELTRDAMRCAYHAKKVLLAHGVKWGVNRKAAEQTIAYLRSQGWVNAAGEDFVTFRTIHDNLKLGR